MANLDSSVTPRDCHVIMIDRMVEHAQYDNILIAAEVGLKKLAC